MLRGLGFGCLVASCSVVSWVIAGCGSGGGSPSPPPVTPPTPSFTLSLNTQTLSLTQGGSQSVKITVNPRDGFSDTVSVAVSGLLPGVSVSPAPLSIDSGKSGTLTFSASPYAELGQTSVSLSATVPPSRGGYFANATLAATVSGSGVPDPLFRLGGEIVHGFYDQSRQMLFATNPGLNEVDVLSGKDMSVVTRIPVPQPWGIDQMPDGKTLVIGTKSQQIVTVDQDTLAVAHFPFNAPSSYGDAMFFPNLVTMANGKVLIIGQIQGEESDDILDGGQYLVEWDSGTNTFSVNAHMPGPTVSLARSADHNWAFFSSDQFYLYSSAFDSFTAFPRSVDPDAVQGAYALNSDASRIGIVSLDSVKIFDRSMNELGSVSIPYADFAPVRTSVRFSRDDASLYLQYDFPMAVEKIDPLGFRSVGYISANVLPNSNTARLLDVDAGERAYLGNADAIRLVDLHGPYAPMTASHPGPYCMEQVFQVPLNQATKTFFPGSYAASTNFYINGQPAILDVANNLLNIPASSIAGPADLECIDQNGLADVADSTISYGVLPMGLGANLLPPTGDATVDVYGFGMSASFTEIPNITIGGQIAPSLGSAGKIQSMQIFAAKVPKGTPGQTVDVSVSSSLGSGTMVEAATYLPAPTILRTAGVLQILCDPHRNVLYALKANEIDILSAQTLQWQTPISLPNTASFNMMALSPDGQYLVAASPSHQIAVLNPDQPSAISTLQVGATFLAIAQGNILFVGPYEVDLPTLTVYTKPQPWAQVLRATADGSMLYGIELNESGGDVFSVDPATNVINHRSFGYLFWSDVAVSPDGTRIATVFGAPPGAGNGDAVGFFDPELHYLNTNAYPSTSWPDDGAVLGAQFSPKGTVLVVPLGDSIEFWDSATGKLRARLMTPEELITMVYPENPMQTMMAIDSTGKTIFAVSQSGISVIPLLVDIDSLPNHAWRSFSVHSGAPAAMGVEITSRMRAMTSRIQRH